MAALSTSPSKRRQDEDAKVSASKRATLDLDSIPAQSPTPSPAEVKALALQRRLEQALPEGTFYFWVGDACSYSLAELRHTVDVMLKVSVPTIGSWSKETVGYVALTPHGYKHTFCASRLADATIVKPTVDEAIENIMLWRDEQTLERDKSRALGHSECPLTLEPYQKPYRLSYNERSYSKAAIVDAIDKTLKRGLSLRLEDCIIHFAELPNLRLVPNHGLPGWDGQDLDDRKSLEYSEKDIVALAPFNEAAALAQTFDEASTWLDSVVDHSDTLRIPDDVLARFRQRRPDMPKDSVIFSNLVLRNIVWPRSHLKQPMVFHNVHFLNCVIVHNCFCNMKFYGCRFTGCIFLVHPHNHGLWAACEYLECSWAFACSPRFNETDPWHAVGFELDVQRIEHDRSAIESPIYGGSISWRARFVYDSRLTDIQKPIVLTYDELYRVTALAIGEVMPANDAERTLFKDRKRYDGDLRRWTMICE